MFAPEITGTPVGLRKRKYAERGQDEGCEDGFHGTAGFDIRCLFIAVQTFKVFIHKNELKDNLSQI
jgi:hypothetical protein